MLSFPLEFILVNANFFQLPQSQLTRLQRLQNAAAR